MTRDESERHTNALVAIVLTSLDQGALEDQAEDKGKLIRFPEKPRRDS
jgi:hypothetical protein